MFFIENFSILWSYILYFVDVITCKWNYIFISFGFTHTLSNQNLPRPSKREPVSVFRLNYTIWHDLLFRWWSVSLTKLINFKIYYRVCGWYDHLLHSTWYKWTTNFQINKYDTCTIVLQWCSKILYALHDISFRSRCSTVLLHDTIERHNLNLNFEIMIS